MLKVIKNTHDITVTDQASVYKYLKMKFHYKVST